MSLLIASLQSDVKAYFFFFFFFNYRIICIIDNGASRRRTRNARFRVRRADHSTTSMCDVKAYLSDSNRVADFTAPNNLIYKQTKI